MAAKAKAQIKVYMDTQIRACLSTNNKSGKVYVVLSWYQNKKRQQKSIPTNLSPKYGARAGETVMAEVLDEWAPKLLTDDNTANNDPSKVDYTNMLLGMYLLDWVERKKKSIESTTYHEYEKMVRNRIAPYFDERNITLQCCGVNDIETFYEYRMEKDGVSGNTISHYQACLFSAFKDAWRRELISSNPAAKVQLPRAEKFRGAVCTKVELDAIISAAVGTWLEIPIYLASWLGLRRGEIVGIRWKDIDFEQKTLAVCGVVTYRSGGGEGPRLDYRNYTKTDAGMRSFPLSDDNIRMFKHWRAQQAQNRLLAGAQYDTTWEEFVCVNELGGLISPNYISSKFKPFLKKHKLREVRFHDLRHTNSVLLLSNGAPMQEVKDWLGHESVSTTDKYYGGIFIETKKRTANLMNAIMTKAHAKESIC